MKLSVVYSFFNEEANLPELIRRTRLAFADLQLKRGECEMIFVNDVSNDRSVEILHAHMGEGDVKLVNTSRNFGNAACILAGFTFATGERIAYLDADLQDPPELIPRLYRASIEEGADIVHTRRTKRHGETAGRMFLTRIGYAILGRSLCVPLPSNVGDFKLLTRRVVDAVLRLNEPMPFMRGMISYVGFKQKTVEYERDARFGGETHYPVYSWRVISNFVNNAIIGYSDLPVHAILGMSAFSFVFALIVAVYALLGKIMGLVVPGTAGILIVTAGFSAMIMFSIGILGLYMISIKKAVLRRPTYIVESTSGFSQSEK